jgi:hypothetical protein
VFQTGIYIFSETANLNLIKYIPYIFSSSSSNVYSFDASSRYLAYAVNSSLIVLNITNISNPIQIYQATLVANFDDIQIQPPYLIMLTGGNLLQFDL